MLELTSAAIDASSAQQPRRLAARATSARIDAGSLPPLVILGGEPNALSVARSLGSQGIRVYALPDDYHRLRWSRYCRALAPRWAVDDETTWKQYLLGPESDWLSGAVLLACSDVGIKIIVENHEALSQKFLLDDCHPPAQLCMLNKLSTYQAAVAAGVPAPRFWEVGCRQDIGRLRNELVFPLLVKPCFSPGFGQIGGKFLVASDFDQLLDAHRRVSDAGISVVLLELIPGPDRNLCSYYTYLDPHGEPLFDFTKRIIRRFPVGMGNACYHITDWNPEVKEVAMRLLRHVGLRGLANVEFKRDDRDGQLKLIECNARFTAANCLVMASGFDLPRFVYNRLVGLPSPPLESYARGRRLWYPIQDFRSYLVLRKTEKLTLWSWIASVAHPQMLPYFKWYDPLPAIAPAIMRSKAVRLALRSVKALIALLRAATRRQ